MFMKFYVLKNKKRRRYKKNEAIFHNIKLKN